MGSYYCDCLLKNISYIKHKDMRPVYLIIFSLLSLIISARNLQDSTTWDPWAPCQDDSDCPDWLMCNQWQNRCTECVDNKDCPACLNDDCPFPGEGVCVYGDHCCTPDFC